MRLLTASGVLDFISSFYTALYPVFPENGIVPYIHINIFLQSMPKNIYSTFLPFYSPRKLLSLRNSLNPE